MKMSRNSLSAYDKVRKFMPRQERIVFQTICILYDKKSSFRTIAKEIALYTDISLESVTARINALKQRGAIKHYKDIKVNGYRNACYCPTSVSKLKPLKINNWHSMYDESQDENKFFIHENLRLKRIIKKLGKGELI